MDLLIGHGREGPTALRLLAGDAEARGFTETPAKRANLAPCAHAKFGREDSPCQTFQLTPSARAVTTTLPTRQLVERERAELREFVAGLSPDEIRSGAWFTKLCAQALDSYTDKVDWRYFQERYEGVPADAIVDQRIKMAARYAAIEGGLSAGAYTAAIVATIGSAGGASPVIVPAAFATVMVDVAFITRLQLRLAYDVAVLYRVPIDLSDPDDMWKLIRVAFTIKSGEAVREGVVKVVPLIVRPLIKRFYSRSVLTAAKALPVVGKFLLQRTVIKIGIPLVGVPLAVLLNR